jgi:transcription antitermination factor NusG
MTILQRILRSQWRPCDRQGRGMITSTSWGVIVALHQCQRVVSDGLTARQIEHFIPMEKRWRVVRGRRSDVHYPLFGRYILTTICSAWREIKNMRGVAGMLCNEDGFPAQCLTHEVERIRKLCNNNVFIEEDNCKVAGFVYGQRVTPKSGPLAFHVGKFDSVKRSSEAAIFNLFGREQKVVFRKGDLIAA